MGNPTCVYLIIEGATPALRVEAETARQVFGLQEHPSIVSELYETPVNGFTFLEVRPLGSKSGWEACTLHMRFVRFMTDLCERLRSDAPGEVVDGYSLVIFDDGGARAFSTGDPGDERSAERRRLEEALEGFDTYDRVARQNTRSGYGQTFGPADSPAERERVSEAARRVLAKVG